MVLTVSFVLSPVIGLSCHRRLRILHPQSLTRASRRQDHTTSPSALALFVKSAAASIASRPNVRDDGQRPSLRGQDSGGYKVIWVFGKPEYFCKRGWTGHRQTAPLICPSGRRATPVASASGDIGLWGESGPWVAAQGSLPIATNQAGR